MDSAPPPPPAILEPAPARVAALDIYPRTPRERELCESASSPDWLYLAIPPVLVAGAIALDTQVFKYDGSAFVRSLGPVTFGLTWGLFIGSFYPSMPKCSPHWVPTAPPEGEVRTSWPIALSFALLAAVSAPVLEYITIGPVPTTWDDPERISRIVFASGFAFAAAFIPYVLPPKTVRASRELMRLRPSVSAHGSFVSYTLQF